MKLTRTFQIIARHGLENARWYLVIFLVLFWFGALGKRLEHLRRAAGTGEQEIALRTRADKKFVPLRVNGVGAYFRIRDSRAGGAKEKSYRLEPLMFPLRVDGRAVGPEGLELGSGKPSRTLDVDGLRLNFFSDGESPILAQTAWRIDSDCTTMGSGLSSSISLEINGVSGRVAELCRGKGQVRNVSTRQAIWLAGRRLGPGEAAPWNPKELVILELQTARGKVPFRISTENRSTLVEAPETVWPKWVIHPPSIVGSLQMNYTRTIPREKVDYEFLESVEASLEQIQGAETSRAGADNPDRLFADALDVGGTDVANLPVSRRMDRLLEESRRELAAGRPENSHFLASPGGSLFLGLRPRAVTLRAPAARREHLPSRLVAGKGGGSFLELLDGPLKGSLILLEAPVSKGKLDLVVIGSQRMEMLAPPSDLHLWGGEPGALALAGRTVILSNKGAATMRPGVLARLGDGSKAYYLIRRGDTLSKLLRAWAAVASMRKPLLKKVLKANPNLDPRRMKPGQRIEIALDWPELSKEAKKRVGSLGSAAHVRLERHASDLYLRVLSGPVWLEGNSLAEDAIVPLRDGDGVRVGNRAFSVRRSSGVLRERRLRGGRFVERYPMGSAAVLLGGFEERLSPVVSLPSSGAKKLSIDADLQMMADRVLRSHLEWLGSLDGRAYKRKGKVHGGSLVALDYRTGEILASASFPAFDPAVPGNYRVAKKKMGASAPFLNRAFRSTRAPGSVFKLVVLAAWFDQLERRGELAEKSVSKGPGFWCGDGYTAGSGAIILGGKKVRCHRWKKGGHGWVRNPSMALQKSCNVYIAKLALRMAGLTWKEPSAVHAPQRLDPKGIPTLKNPLFSMASRLGFDFDYRGQGPKDRKILRNARTPSQVADLFQPLGIIPAARPVSGSIPAPLHYVPGARKLFDPVAAGLKELDRRPILERKPVRHLAYLAIGQDMTATTLELGLLTATIANGGVMPRLRIVPFSSPNRGKPKIPPDSSGGGRRIFSQAVAARIAHAMELVTQPGGTAPPLRSREHGGRYPFIIRAKTGTAQVSGTRGDESRRADSLLVAYVDDPRLPSVAMACRVENGDATRNPRGGMLPTTAKHLANRFFTSLGEMYGAWPEPPSEKPPAKEEESR